MTYKIYALKTLDKVFYIGCTTTQLSSRLSQHKWDAYNRASKKALFIKQLLENRTPIVIELIEECSKEDWSARESYWINFYNINNLQNSVIGGTGIILGRNRESIERSSTYKWRAIIKYSLLGEPLEEYENIKEAAKSNNTTSSAITNSICGFSRTCKGNLWGHKGEDVPKPYKRSPHPSKIYFQRVEQLSIEEELIKEYLSIKEAAIAIGISRASILAYCKGISKCKSYTFRFKD